MEPSWLIRGTFQGFGWEIRAFELMGQEKGNRNLSINLALKWNAEGPGLVGNESFMD